MRIRRALAAAAATAAIVPAALMAAPAAYADEGGAAETAQTEQTADPTPPAGDTEQSGDESSDPGQEASEPAGEPTGEATEPADESTDDATDEAGEPTDEATEPTGEPTDDATAPAGEPTDEASDPSTEPSDDATGPADDEPLCTEGDFTSTVTGFPNKIVAGSGWDEFHLNMHNGSDETLGGIELGMSVIYKKNADADYDKLTTSYASLEYFDPGLGKWVNEFSESDEKIHGSLAFSLDIPAGETVSVRMRVRVSENAPAGGGLAFAYGLYGDLGSADCQATGNWYQFDILPANDEAGDVVDVKPQGGKSPVDVKPQGDVQELSQLAETGSSSNLTAIGLSGAAAVVLGAGAVVVMRRRKAGDAA